MSQQLLDIVYRSVHTVDKNVSATIRARALRDSFIYIRKKGLAKDAYQFQELLLLTSLISLSTSSINLRLKCKSEGQIQERKGVERKLTVSRNQLIYVSSFPQHSY